MREAARDYDNLLGGAAAAALRASCAASSTADFGVADLRHSVMRRMGVTAHHAAPVPRAAQRRPAFQHGDTGS